jgi:iron complex transport system substrate-binding protein
VFLGSSARRNNRGNQIRPALPRGARWRFAIAAIAGIAGVALSAAACTGDGTRSVNDGTTAIGHDSTIELKDDGGTVVRLAGPARRVISLVPSATETFIAIGAVDRLVGRTRYDVAAQLATLPSVGGGIDPSVEAIVKLHPDLVVSWANDKRQLIRERLIALDIPVFIIRTEDTTDVFRNIVNLGRLTGRDSAASAVAASVRAELADVVRSVAGRSTPSVLYVVYNDPPMTTGPDTFIGQLISLAGARSIFADATALWPNVAMEEVVRRDPDILVVPVGEFKKNAVERFHDMTGWRDLRAVREGHVVAVPADLLSRPGPSIGEAARVLRAAFHPDAVPAR